MTVKRVYGALAQPSTVVKGFLVVFAPYLRP